MGYCGPGSPKLWSGQLETVVRSAENYSPGSRNFSPGSRKFFPGQPENYCLGGCNF